MYFFFSVPEIFADDITVNEDDGLAEICVRLVNSIEDSFVLDYSVTDGEAKGMQYQQETFLSNF